MPSFFTPSQFCPFFPRRLGSIYFLLVIVILIPTASHPQVCERASLPALLRPLWNGQKLALLVVLPDLLDLGRQLDNVALPIAKRPEHRLAKHTKVNKKYRDRELHTSKLYRRTHKYRPYIRRTHS